MEILDAMRMMVADPDGHFRLKRCRCGSENVVYIQGIDGLWTES